MRKKTYFALALLGAVVGMSAFSSCKDDYDTYTEVRNELSGQTTLIESLRKTIDKLQLQIDALKAAEGTCNCDNSNLATSDQLTAAQNLLQSQIDALKLLLNGNDEVEGLVEQLNNLENLINGTDDKDGLADQVSELLQALTDAEGKIIEVQGLAEALSQLSVDFNSLKNEIGDFDFVFINANVRDLLERVAELEAKTHLTQADVDNTVTTAIDALRTELMTAISSSITEAIDNFKEGELIEIINGKIDDKLNSSVFPKLNELYDEYKPKVDELGEKVDKLWAALQTMITGIAINATDNPVTGSINTPVGIRTNLLFAYYGKSVNDLVFPTDGWGSTVGYIDEKEALTDDEAAFIASTGNVPSDVYSNETIVSEGNNAGTIYLTVNPNTVDYTGKVLQLVNSQGVAPALTLSPLKLSDRTLGFGITRGNENGFYEASVRISPEDIESGKVNKFELDKDELINTGKTLVEAIKSRSITDIAKTVYDMINPDLDAYALKASYENVDGEVSSIFSDYSIAAAAVNAPSFGLINAIPHVWTIPGYERAQKAIDFFAKKINGIFNNINFSVENLNHISLDTDISIDASTSDLVLNQENLDKFVIRISVLLDPYSDMYIVAPVYENGAYVYENGDLKFRVYDKATWEAVNDIELNPTDEATLKACFENWQNGMDMDVAYAAAPDYIEAFVVYNLAEAIEELINEVYNSATGSIGDAIGDVSDAVNDAITSPEDAINDMIDQINNGFFDELNSVLDQLNSVQGTVNDLASSMHNVLEKLNAKVAGFINNLGYYVKPALLYNGADGAKMLAPSLNYPTEISAADCDFIATSMSAEVIVPFAMKHLAVVNVYNMDRTPASNALSLAAAVNGSGKMNKVIKGAGDGSLSDPKPSNFIAASGFQSGYIYEIAYSVVDYAGYRSTRRYYVAVK